MKLTNSFPVCLSIDLFAYVYVFLSFYIIYNEYMCIIQFIQCIYVYLCMYVKFTENNNLIFIIDFFQFQKKTKIDQ